MKLGKIMDANFDRVLNKLLMEPVSLKSAINIKKTLELLRKEYAEYEQERKILLEKYSIKNEDGSMRVNSDGNIAVDENNTSIFMQEISCLLNKEIQIDKIDLRNISENSSNLYTAEEIFLLDDILLY
jgi:hypothetical protein